MFCLVTRVLETSLIRVFESYQVNATIANCTFNNNRAIQSGNIFSSESMRTNLNYLQMLNNTFSNNNCGSNGGLFNFVNVLYKISSIGNTYTNNKAILSGGIGYVYKSEIWYSEDNGYYSGLKK